MVPAITQNYETELFFVTVVRLIHLYLFQSNHYVICYIKLLNYHIKGQLCPYNHK